MSLRSKGPEPWQTVGQTYNITMGGDVPCWVTTNTRDVTT